VTKRYGGVDSILLWPTYTNIGTDARSQFDLFSAMCDNFGITSTFPLEPGLPTAR